jgi:hypothetical protein
MGQNSEHESKILCSLSFYEDARLILSSRPHHMPLLMLSYTHKKRIFVYLFIDDDEYIYIRICTFMLYEYVHINTLMSIHISKYFCK